jgi:hypothetical protein
MSIQTNSRKTNPHAKSSNQTHWYVKYHKNRWHLVSMMPGTPLFTFANKQDAIKKGKELLMTNERTVVIVQDRKGEQEERLISSMSY